MLQSIVRSRFWSAELNPNLFQLLDIPRLDGELQNQKLYIYIYIYIYIIRCYRRTKSKQIELPRLLALITFLKSFLLVRNQLQI